MHFTIKIMHSTGYKVNYNWFDIISVDETQAIQMVLKMAKKLRYEEPVIVSMKRVCE